MRSRHAFTLIELTIVIAITAILAMAFAVSVPKARHQATFNTTKNEITALFQKARSLSLVNLMVNDTVPTDYYLLTFTGTGLSLSAYGTDGSSEALDSVSLDSAILLYDEDGSTAASAKVYYTPPYGEVCFGTASSTDCDDTDTTKSFVLKDSEQSFTATFTVYSQGGYIEMN